MMLSFRWLAVIGSVVAVIGTSALQAEGLKVAALDRKTEINFNKEIYPFFKRNCLACHNNSKAKAKLILETADDIRKGSSDGAVMIPGKADESLLFTTSAHLEEDVMPPKNNKSKAKNLTPQELALLKLWINQGGKGSGAVIAEAPKEWLKLKTSQPIYALAVSPDGRYAASARGQQIDVYDIKLRQWLARLVDPALKTEAHHDLVRSLAFDEDGTLASGGYRMIKLWRASAMTAKKYQAKPEDAKALATSKDGTWSLYLDEKRTQLKRLIHASKKTSVLELPSPVSGVAILPDQKEVALGFDSGTIRVMQVAGLDQPEPSKPIKPVDAKVAAAKKVAASKALYYELKGHGKGKLQFIRDEKHALVSASTAGKVIVWDLKQKKPKWTFNHGAGLVYVALQSKVNRLLTASASGRVLIWDLSKPAKYLLSIGSDPNVKMQVAQLSIDKSVAGVDIRRVTALVKKMEETTKKELESSKGIIKEIPEKEKALKEAQKKLSELSAVKPPAKEVDAAKKKREAGVKLAKEEVDKLLSKIASLKVGKARAVVMQDKATKSLTAAKADKVKLEAHLKSLDEKLKAANDLQAKTASKYVIAGADFSKDGNYLAVAYQNGNVHLYAADRGAFIETLFTKKKIKEVFFEKRGLVTLAEDGAWSWPVQRTWAYTRSIGNGKDGKILIDRVTALGFGPQSTLVSASGIPSRKGQLKLWDLKTLKLKAQNLDSHKDLITSINFSPDKKQIVTGSSDGTAKIYDLQGLKMIRSLEGHSLAVLDVSWSGDGRLIATSGADGGIVLWDSVTGEKYRTIRKSNGEEVTIVKFMSKNSEGLLVSEGGQLLKANNKNLPGAFKYVYSASLTPDGAMILAGGQSGSLRLWDAKKYSLLKTFDPEK